MGYPLNDNEDFPLLPPKSKGAATEELDFPVLKKKVGGNANGADSNLYLSAPQPTQTNQQPKGVPTINYTYQPQVANSNLGVDVGMKVPDTKSMREQEKKTSKEAVLNATHQYFDNNKNLLKELSKNNKKLIAKDAEGKDIEDEYDLNQLEKTSVFQNKLAEVNKGLENGSTAVTYYQKGKNAGKPGLSRAAGFWESLGGSIANSVSSTKDALVTMTKSPKEVADYFDEQRRNMPEIAESTPTGVGSMVGGALGGIIKPAAEFYIGEQIEPLGGGLVTAAADIIPSTTTQKTKEIYFDRMAALENKYGAGNVPEAERLDAITKAQQQAPLQAIPEEAMQLYLFGKGMGGGANEAALQTFKQTLTKAGGDIGKMAVLGGVSELGTQGIKQAQTGEGKFDENISAAAGNWALMEAGFKLLPVTAKALGLSPSKPLSSSAKNLLTTADPTVVQKLSEQAVKEGWLTQDQAKDAVKDVADFAAIKGTIPENLSQDKQQAIAGLIQKNKALEEEKKTKDKIFHDDIDAEIKANEQKAKDILNSNSPLKHETDELTGQRGQDVGGRPTKGEPENISQPIELNPEITNEPITAIAEKEKQAQTEIPNKEGTNGSAAVDEPVSESTVEGSTTKEDVVEPIQSQQRKVDVSNINNIINPNHVGIGERMQDAEKNKKVTEQIFKEDKNINYVFRNAHKNEVDNILNEGGKTGDFWRSEPNEYNGYGDYLIIKKIPNIKEYGRNFSKGNKIEHDAFNYIGEKADKNDIDIIIDKETGKIVYNNNPELAKSLTQPTEQPKENKLIEDISKIPLDKDNVTQRAFIGKPDKLLAHIQNDATGFSKEGERKNIGDNNYEAAVKTYGKEIVDRAIDALPEADKKRITENLKPDAPQGLKDALGIKEKEITLQNGTEAENISQGQNKGDADNIKPLDEKTIKEKLSKLDQAEITDPYDKVLAYFANDGKIHPDAINKFFGGKNSRIRIKTSTEGEKRARIGLINKKAPTIEGLAHKLWEADQTGKYDTQDYKNAIEDVLLGHNSKASMAKELVEKYDYETAYKKYLDQHGQEFSEVYDKLSEDEMNHILELDADKERDQELADYIEELQKTPPPIEGEPPLKEGIHVEQPKTVLTHRGLQEIATEFGGEDVTPRERESRLRQAKDAENEIDKWKSENSYTKNINDIISRAKEGKIDEVEQFILANHIATLREQLRDIGKSKGIHSQEFKDKFDELSNVAEAGKVMRSKAGGLLGAKAIGVPDDTLEGYLMQEKDLNKGAELTDNQITTAVNEFERVKAAKEEFQKKYEDLQADYAKLLAEREVKKTASTTTKNTKKTHDDYVKERSKVVEDIREKLKKARGQTNVTIVPYANELIAIAPDVAKLAKSLIEEGVTKLEDVVKNIHAQLKSEIPNLEEKDVHDILAGNYAEKKKTRSQVAEQMQNLKTQAQLINKYEAMLKGEKPKNEKKLIKYNQEIDALRKKIKGLEKEEKEANTFYGESDSGNKRIEKMEDELQRLKERRPKEPTQKEEREISEREKELKEQIAEERKKIRAEEKEANTRYQEEIPDEVKKLRALKKRNESELAKIQEELKTGDFAEPVKKKSLTQDAELKKNFPKAYQEALDSQTKLIKAKQERQLRIALQQFDNLSAREKFAKNAIRYLNVPRTLMSSMDYSAPLRQAAVATVAHPFTAARAFKTMFQHGWSQEAFDRYYHDLQESPRWRLMQDSKLAVTDPHSLHLNAQEEAFLGGNVAEKIPIVGRGVKASERAYVSYLNKMRIDLFNRYADLFEDAGKTFDNSPELYKGLASFINAATGRGSLGFADAAAPMLNSFLFSPRLIASRLNLLTNWANPKFYKQVPKEVRALYFKDMAKFVAAGVSVLALAKYGFGANVELDPRSSDFGKIVVGNTRWDIWGGFQQYIRVFAQIMTGQRKTEKLGVYDIDKKFGQSRLDVLSSFARGKLAPIPSITADVIGSRNIQGQKIEKRFDIPFYSADNPAGNGLTYTDEMFDHLMPLIVSDMQSAMKDQGVKALFTVGIPSTFGVGVQTYEPNPPSAKLKPQGRPQRPQHKGRGNQPPPP